MKRINRIYCAFEPEEDRREPERTLAPARDNHRKVPAVKPPDFRIPLILED